MRPRNKAQAQASRRIVSDDYTGPRDYQVVAKVDKVSRTEQHHRDSTHLPTIVRKYHSTGELPTLNPKTPLYGDFYDAPSFHEAATRVAQAKSVFAALPSTVRTAAENSAAEFLAMFFDREGREALIQAGLDAPPIPLDDAPADQGAPTPPSQPNAAQVGSQEPAAGDGGAGGDSSGAS